MYQALVEQLQMPDIATLTFEERFGLLVDRECTEREHRRLTTRLRQAKLRQTACIEDLDDRHPRGLDKSHSIGFSGKEMGSCVEGSSARDFPLIHDTQSQDYL
jgi:hypothetical protein